MDTVTGLVCPKCGSSSSHYYYSTNNEPAGCDKCLPPSCIWQYDRSLNSPSYQIQTGPYQTIVAAIDRLTEAVNMLREEIRRK